MSILKPLLRISKRLMREFCLSVWYPRVYRRAARQPLVPGKVVFVEVREPKLSDSFKLMHERLQREPGLSLSVLFLGESRVRYTQYHRNCLAMLREIATAPYVFLNDASNVVSCVPLREGSQVVQLWHGCGAFKKWGMSTADLKFGGSRKQKLRHPFYSNLSLVTTSSPEVNWAYIEAMHLEDMPQVVQALGVSRTDIFFRPDFLQRSHARVEQALPAIAGRKILLYAPTFRGRVASAEGPDQLDIECLKREFGDRWALVIKHHPFVKEPPAIPAGCEDFAFDVTHGDLAIDELMVASSACISDYSSLVFEYSLLRRPLAFFAYDRSDYDDWRGFYYDYDELTPGPVCTTTEELVAWLTAAERDFDATQINAFREKFMSACDGHATERIVRAVFGPAIATNLPSEEE